MARVFSRLFWAGCGLGVARGCLREEKARVRWRVVRGMRGRTVVYTRVDGAGRLESGVNACGVLGLSGAGSGIQKREWDSLDWGSGLGGVGVGFLAPVRVRLPSCPYSRVRYESRDYRHVAADAAAS